MDSLDDIAPDPQKSRAPRVHCFTGLHTRCTLTQYGSAAWRRHESACGVRPGNSAPAGHRRRRPRRSCGGQPLADTHARRNNRYACVSNPTGCPSLRWKSPRLFTSQSHVSVSPPTVLDTHGEWLHAWASRLKKCGAEHVRVPCTGTPLPQPLGLQAFATATKRTAELQRSSPRVVPVPSVQLYADYIAHACSAPGAATRAVTMRRGTVTALVRCKSRLVVAILQLQPDTDTLHVHCIECAW